MPGIRSSIVHPREAERRTWSKTRTASMSTVIHTGEYIDPPVNAKKDGDYYDTCPHDACMEVDALHRSEGEKTGPREAHHDWSIYNADVRKGGCGFTWTRTTSTGAERDHNLGRES